MKLSYGVYGRLSASNVQENSMLVIGCCMMTINHPLCAMIQYLAKKIWLQSPTPVLSRSGSQGFVVVDGVRLSL
jgi:hypothetical protein